jgi:agmatinase
MVAQPDPPRQPQEPWPNLRARPRSFFNAPLCDDIGSLEADVAFVGIPFDQGTLGRPGARFGPDALRDAPRGYSYSDPYGAQGVADGFFDIDAENELLRGVTMADCGNVPIVPSEVVGNFDRITRAVEQVVERGALPVAVGGDHAITFPVVRGLSKFAPLNIVHFDAHLDYSHDIQDALYTHASPIRRCRELDFVGHITSVGIRSARRIPYEEAVRDGSLIVSHSRFRKLGPRAVADLIPPAENLYITFDVDVLDPTQAPGTGTPETGGLFYEEARECLLTLLQKSNLVAFDVVEVAPPYDNSELTVQVASRLIQDILAARFPSR